MTQNSPPTYYRFGQWLIKLSQIDAIGPNEKGEITLVLNSGFVLVLTRDEAREVLAFLEPDADWRK